jgi:Mrp family chromosome partitioning ATPase
MRAVDVDAVRRNRLLSPAATGPAARAYKLLRTQVLQRMQQEGYRSLAIVSAEQGDGRTTTAINLGISIGEDADHTSLVVDLDLRRPGVAQAFGIAVQDGVDRCLRGESDVADVLVAPQGYQSLTLLPAGNPVPQSSELLSSDRAGAVLGEVVRRYANRIVLFDLPPLLVTDDALALMPCAEAALLVVHEGRTRRQDVERALDLIGRVPVIGTVLHGSREPVTAA